MKTLLAYFLLVGTASVVAAQSHKHPDPGQPAQLAQLAQHTGSSQYAGYQEREIKALSPQQIEDLQAGRGMSLALAAELNGFPGPSHVVELGEKLWLTQSQQRETMALTEQMKADAQRLGKAAIETERELDSLFKRGCPSEASVTQAVERIALAHASLRASHLNYHLRTVAILTPLQIARYQELRGYTAPAGTVPNHVAN
ncbi:Spy/CpxP family protein refolding chaperone [Acidovorax kalamii]|uniref:Periplasmic heavy metal sensor n=1 Tax=Acidovorax kalamii TaxID=2004485 RepID=A0A235EHR8_9BURK|nr:hypothetical protein [Acidovorax kalamii]OYD48117.1 hypothetical protein CBY09_21465 [Acidovorax kalamii]